MKTDGKPKPWCLSGPYVFGHDDPIKYSGKRTHEALYDVSGQ